MKQSKILYLVHDLSDAAVQKRFRSLVDAGASVTIAGFHRRRFDSEIYADGTLIQLGEVQDGRYLNRILRVLTADRRPFRAIGYHAVIARNLEMLMLASRLRRKTAGGPKLVYECLDINRLMLGSGHLNKLLRWLERRLLRGAHLLIVSSPAFEREYFSKLQGLSIPVLLLENKVPPLKRPPLSDHSSRVFKIGWFGVLRCAKSLAILREFAKRMNGRFEVILRGIPARQEFEDFDRDVMNEPNLTYLGSYSAPRDLADIYQDIDLVWAIDFFEEGLNSDWLLPNRIYEGPFHGAVPIVYRGTETARFARDLGIGLELEYSNSSSMELLLRALNREQLRELQLAVRNVPDNKLMADAGEYVELVKMLSES